MNLNEDELVAAIAQFNGAPHSRVTLGIGDDAAAWQPSRSARSVVTTDALVEGVHFSRALMTMRDIGMRAMAANLSDVAAMGARPLLVTVALGIPKDLDPTDVLECYRGLDACARAFRVQIVGGDLTRSPVLLFSITVIGEVRSTNLKTRSGALPGDVLAVTGPLGASRAGLAQAKGEIALSEDGARAALRSYRTPGARCAAGRFLGASRNVRAMMDCSDGLSTDVARLAHASHMGARIEYVPVAACALEAAAQLGVDPIDFALAGGEDFELLVAVAPRAFEHLSRRYAARFGEELIRLGTVEADERLVVVKQGAPEPMERSGWDHFG